MEQTILEVRALETHFKTDGKEIPAVDNVSFHINKGEVLGIVGESGCGKSVTSLSIMGLVPNPPGRIVGGSINFTYNDKLLDLAKVNEKVMRKIRGNEIAMIFQEPMTALNPVFTIGNQIMENVLLHNKTTKEYARKRAIEMLQKVGIPRPEQTLKAYPHQLSGGMRQRVMIAMAMSCDPKLLIADEPTTALDVTIQAQILELMKKLNNEQGTAIMLITHDLGVVAETCQRVIVMYGGKIVEQGETKEVLKSPQHPYTQGLIKSIPKLNEKEERLYSIPGNVPKPGSIKKGCRFAPRCEFAFARCYEEDPELISLSDKHHARCFLHHEEEKGRHSAWQKLS